MYNFYDIKGNDQILHNLKSAVKNGKIHHAYLFCGEKGMGKKLVSSAFAKAILCEKTDGVSCEECTSCRTFNSGNNPDVIHVTSGGKKIFPVDVIREQVLETIDIRPYKYKKKIYFIHDADTMNLAAQNALLKTLEEPPSYAVIILLAQNREKFLPTILSRCIEFKLRPLPAEMVREYLISKHGLSQQDAAIYAEYAQGNIGRALETASSEEFTAMRLEILGYLSKIHSADRITVMSWAKEFEKYKEKPVFFDIMLMWYRDLLVMKLLKGSNFLIEKDQENELRRQSREESESSLIKKIEDIWRAKRQIEQNGNFILSMELLLMHLRE